VIEINSIIRNGVRFVGIVFPYMQEIVLTEVQAREFVTELALHLSLSDAAQRILKDVR